MIPKQIHYCWFGYNPKPELAQKCINSWKEFCPDFDIIEWNEENFDISKTPLYVRQAYNEKRWSFVTDYVRLKVIYDNGGVYFDTDVQIIKSIDDLLNNDCFFGFENEKWVNTGLGFGAKIHSKILFDILKQYDSINFIDDNGTIDLTPCPQRNTEVFKKYGLKQNGLTQIIDKRILILSPEYLCPIDYDTKKKNVTKKTYTIHWFTGSWKTKEEIIAHKKYLRREKVNNAKQKMLEFSRKSMGKRFTNKLLDIKHRKGNQQE